MNDLNIEDYKRTYMILKILYGRSIHSHTPLWRTIKKEIEDAIDYELLAEWGNIPQGSRRCSKCGLIKQENNLYFNRRKDGKGGLHSECKICRSYRRGESEIGYIKKLLCNGSDLKFDDIPMDMVRLKQIQLKLKKELRKWTK